MVLQISGSIACTGGSGGGGLSGLFSGLSIIADARIAASEGSFSSEITECSLSSAWVIDSGVSVKGDKSRKEGGLNKRSK